MPCDLSVPLKLLCIGPIGFTSLDCLGLSRFFRVFAARPPVSTSGAFPPMGLVHGVATSLQGFVAASRVPFGGIEVPTTSRSGGVSAAPAFPYEVFAPAAKRPLIFTVR